MAATDPSLALREGGQALAAVGDRGLGKEFAGGREDAHRMAAVPEVDTDGNVVRGHKAESNRLTLCVRGALRLLITSRR